MNPTLLGRVKNGSLTLVDLSGSARRRKHGMDEGATEEKKDEHDALWFSPEVAALVSALAENSSVTSLKLKNHGLDAQSAKFISRTIQRNTGIVSMSLAGNKIGCDGVIALCQALQFNNTLQILDLSSNELLDEGAYTVANLLRRNSTLRKLDLTSCGVYQKGSIALFQSLVNNTTLTQLYFAKNHCLSEGARELGIALAENFTLQCVDISNNFIFEEGAKDIAKSLCLSLAGGGSRYGKGGGSTTADEKFDSVATLDLRLSSNEIGDAGAKALASALMVKGVFSGGSGRGKAESGSTLCTRLNSLVISENLITHRGAKDLAVAIASQRALTALQLCDNNIGAKGAEAIGKALKSPSCGLISLKLMACDIPASGVKAICKNLEPRERSPSEKRAKDKDENATSSQCSLQYLNLSWNHFGVEGGKHLGAMLARNSSLTRLHLAHTKLQCAGTAHMFAGLETNSLLKELDISNNHIRGAGAEAIGRSLTAHADTPALVSLKLDGNSFGDALVYVVNIISNCLARNVEADIREKKVAFFMGLHPSVGIDSSLGRVIRESPIADTNALRGIWEMLFDRSYLPLTQRSELFEHLSKKKVVPPP